ncbi:autotransporter outer membrane beta-barrel domain-containing protein [Lysobacter enzymogenes]|uniref:autotransporter outer membrane beta-barrel domain-containing protein n=1 Tax=Lysobacter enzymogenes TaxID=69 RepID=UPI001A95DF75|nr:autotransporter outer membrane beta-barrel domain-containing protein [Lysobacter enzymogenes]QQP94279.1 autotransporter domain-containing protein [Lysobacter enzymogenes]
MRADSLQSPNRIRFHPLSLGVARAIPVLLALQGYCDVALAACTPAAPPDGATVLCTGAPTPFPSDPNAFASGADRLTVTVAAGAVVGANIGGTAMALSGSNVALNNLGSIDATAANGLLLTRGLSVGNLAAPASGQIAIDNSGSILGSYSSFDLSGTAMLVANAGATRIGNAGTIGNAGLGGIGAQDQFAVGVYGGGNVDFSNTGSIVGRIAFADAASGGHAFVNAGQIDGSVGLGGGDDRFVAVTGSSIASDAFPAAATTMATPSGAILNFAATGQVDAGGGDDTLVLQNAATGSGAGSGGAGAIAAAQYRGFERLTINSGTWTLDGAVASAGATLNGGVALFDDAAAFGSGRLGGNGGALQATVGGLALAQDIDLGAGGLTVQGGYDLSLSGTLAGSGGLIKRDAGTLSLSGSNSFAGGVDLGAGSLLLGGDASLGLGALNLTGNASLGCPCSKLKLGNAFNLGAGAGLTLGGATDVELGGGIGGGGSLIKIGAGTLALNGVNGFSGGVRLQAGTLSLGNGSALGSGALAVDGAAALNVAAAMNLNNPIDLNAGLSLGGGVDLGLNGVIGGSGGLSFNGPSTLTLAGANSFSGGFALGGGGLALAGSTALGSGALNVGGNASLSTLATGVVLGNAVNLGAGVTLGIAGSNDLSLGGLIGGAGGLAMTGDGRLDLLGANSFSGGVALAAGTLGLGNDLALGSGALQVGGNAGLVATVPNLTLRNPIDLAAGARLGIGGDGHTCLCSQIRGGGGLSFSGTGTLSLPGANLFAGGMNLNSGTLSLGDNGALGTGLLTIAGQAVLTAAVPGLNLGNDVHIAAGSTLDLIGDNSLDLSGTLVGSGTLIKRGDGELRLDGHVLGFTGGLSILQGTLDVGRPIVTGLSSAPGTQASFSDGDDVLTATGPIAGAVDFGGGNDALSIGVGYLGGVTGSIAAGAGNDTFAVGGSGDGVLPASGLSGFENLSLAPGSTLVLAGGASGAFDRSSIGGTLVLDGTLGGSAAVAAGGALVGGGALAGALTLAGTLAPSGLAGAGGAAAGTGAAGVALNVASLTVDPGAILQLRQSADGRSDSVTVAGAATLNGGVVVAMPQPGDYAPITDYRIVDASALSGAFASVSQSVLPFLDASLLRRGDDVFLRLARHLDGGGLRFEQFPGLSENQRAAAGALQAASVDDAVLPHAVAAARGLSAAQAPRAFDSLSGETYASLASAQRYHAVQFQRSVAAQLDLARDRGVDEERTLGTAWASAYGGRAEFDGGRLDGIDHDLGGLAIGVEGSPAAHWRFGAHLGAARSTSKTGRRDDKIDSDLFNLGVHGLYAPGRWWAQGAAGYSYGRYQAQREVTVGGYRRRARADFGNDGAYAMLEAGLRFDGLRVRMEPLLGVYYAKVESARFRERGAGDADLWVRTGGYDVATVGVGLRLTPAFGPGERKWSPSADIRYLHDLDGSRPRARNGFVGAATPGFDVVGFAAERNRWNVGLGVQYRIGPASSAFVEYRGELGREDRVHALNAGLRLGWGASAAARARPAPVAGDAAAGAAAAGRVTAMEATTDASTKLSTKPSTNAANAAKIASADTSTSASKQSPASTATRTTSASAAAAAGAGAAGTKLAAGDNAGEAVSPARASAPASSAAPAAAGLGAQAGAGFGECKLRPAKQVAPTRKLVQRGGKARPLSKSKRVAARGAGGKAKPRRAPVVALARSGAAAPAATVWCDDAPAGSR